MVISLCFYDNGIGDVGLVVLLRILKENCFVINFDFFENKFGKEGVCVIGEMVLENVFL